jgi:paraquat-inducible protein B
MDTPVTLALYLDLFHMQNATPLESAEARRAALNQLIETGLRARLEREPPLVGSYRVTLEMVPDAPAADADRAKSPPEIPKVSGGGLDSLVTRVKNIPIDQIAQHVLDITQHVDTLVSSPKLTDSVDQLDASLQEVHNVVQDVGPQVDKLVQSLRQAATQLEQTAQSADRALGGAPTQTGLYDTLREMKEAARAVRSFADYLDRHPEALIVGRTGR